MTVATTFASGAGWEVLAGHLRALHPHGAYQLSLKTPAEVQVLGQRFANSGRR
jgi:hypothetical protein